MQPSVPAARPQRYHHGDLKAALIDGAIKVIAERGASGYVRFAAEQRPLFSVVFGVGLDKKSRHRQLRQAYENVEGMLAASVTELCPADPAAADLLADAIEATAHGYAALLTDQPGSPDPAAIDRAAAQAARATLALIRGRAALQADSR